ncbi:hypothetical protein A5733_24750 [Mycobacterium sp. NS-7484]|uniref:hypothetical protein n=1 Tax=Mycobacterium sp. NS-7484 TaxID=1834161 RepID=UPI00097A3B1A|nr:hypothetical protein [Mycobacterium sp. NS-7484]OMC03318.1 hypothetical protein A5733_24750 [Mycobacterium sp. NS-7484]
MSFIHVQFLPEFMLGDDVVMLAMDTAGAAVIHAALNDAVQHGRSRLEHDGVIHEFRIQSGAADIEQVEGRIEWLLDRAAAVEILDDLATPADHPGHQYVDIHTPTSTLVLSYDEYTPEYFAHLPDELRYAKPGES